MHALPLSAPVPADVCADWSLVLTAAGIAHELRAEPGGACLWVAPEDHARAVTQLTHYLHENRRPPAPPRATLLHRHASWAVLAYLATIVLVAGAAPLRLGGRDWVARGLLDAGFLARGEGWRAITALTLHLDPLHLLANAAFGAIFVYATAQLLGVGLALLAILAGATLANTVDALVHPPNHFMLGASTAVFVALGLIAALAWRRRASPWSSTRQRLAPVVAGLALLALTGTGGENTDVLAHLFGFVAGVLLGAVAGTLPLPPPGRARPQWAAAALAAASVVTAWVAALR